jgi:predicted RNA-binding Zn-ribbon protein involved in translation (DUF1610 family)
MITIECPKCGENVKIDIAKAIDENGEVFRCEHCGYKIRYTAK